MTRSEGERRECVDRGNGGVDSVIVAPASVQTREVEVPEGCGPNKHVTTDTTQQVS